MPTILVRVSGHHSNPTPPYKSILDIPAGSDPLTHALLLAIVDNEGIDADQDADRVGEAIAKAKETGEVVPFSLRDPDFPDDEDYEGNNKFSVWYMPPEKPDQKPNFGYGPEDGSDRHENYWIEVEQYEPDPAMRERLEKLDRDKLLAILLRTHAASYLSFPPE